MSRLGFPDAYAGFAITLTSALIAHVAVGDGPEAWDIYEDEPLDEKQLADWIRQAAGQPGWIP